MIIVYFIMAILLFLCILFKKRQNISEQLFERKDTTAIRGISALFVMLAHYAIWFDQVSEVHLNSFVSFPINQLGGIGVLLFFFVSGYGVNESYGKKDNMSGFLSKRFWGVYAPYLLIKFFTISLLVATQVIPWGWTVVLEYLRAFAIPDWFIAVIILQYLFYYLARKFFSEYDVIFSIIADVLMTIVFIFMHKTIGWYNALWLFTFGVIVSKYQKRIENIARKQFLPYTFCSFIGFIGFGLVFAVFKGAAWANFLKPLSGICLSFLLCLLMRKICIDHPFILWCGKRSMFIYIVHIAIWQLIESLSNNVIIVYTVSVLLSIVCTEIVYRVVSFLIKKLKTSLHVA